MFRHENKATHSILIKNKNIKIKTKTNKQTNKQKIHKEKENSWIS